jgi:hypothetical protein
MVTAKQAATPGPPFSWLPAKPLPLLSSSAHTPVSDVALCAPRVSDRLKPVNVVIIVAKIDKVAA